MHPVDAVAAGEAPQRRAALVERLDVEERQVVGAAPDDVVDAAQALDHRRAGEERRDHAERLGAPERQVARGRARPVAELVHDGAHAHAGGLGHAGRVVEHARDGADAHARALGDVANPRRTRSRAFRSAGHDAMRYPRTRAGDAAAVRARAGASALGSRAMARHQLRPLFDRVVIKELEPDRIRRSGPAGPAGSHEPPPQHGIVLAVGQGVDWWEAAGVQMPVTPGRPRRLPGVGRRVGRGRRGAPAGLPRRASCSACSSAPSSRWATPAWATRCGEG